MKSLRLHNIQVFLIPAKDSQQGSCLRHLLGATSFLFFRHREQGLHVQDVQHIQARQVEQGMMRFAGSRHLHNDIYCNSSCFQWSVRLVLRLSTLAKTFVQIPTQRGSIRLSEDQSRTSYIQFDHSEAVFQISQRVMLPGNHLAHSGPGQQGETTRAPGRSVGRGVPALTSQPLFNLVHGESPLA